MIRSPWLAVMAWLWCFAAHARNVCPAGQSYCFFDQMPLYWQDDPREVNAGEWACGLCSPTSAAMTLMGAASEDYYGAYYRNYFTYYYGAQVGDFYGRYYSARPSTVTQVLYSAVPDSNFFYRVNWFAHAAGTDMHGCQGTPIVNMANVLGQRAADFWGYGGSGMTWWPYLPDGQWLASLAQQKIASQVSTDWATVHVDRRFYKMYISYYSFSGHAMTPNGYATGGLPEGGSGPVTYIYNPWGIREWYYTKIMDSGEHAFPTWPAPWTYQDFPPVYYSTIFTTGDQWWLRFIPEFRASNDNNNPILIKFLSAVIWVWPD